MAGRAIKGRANVADSDSPDAGEPRPPDDAATPPDARPTSRDADPNSPDDVYATLEANGAMRSRDAGESWEDCTADLIRAVTFTETKPVLQERIRELGAAGYTDFSIHIRHGHPEMLEEWAEVFSGV